MMDLLATVMVMFVLRQWHMIGLFEFLASVLWSWVMAELPEWILAGCNRCGKNVWMFATRSSVERYMWKILFCNWDVELHDRAKCLRHREWLDCR